MAAWWSATPSQRFTSVRWASTTTTLSPEQGIDELFVGGRQNSNLHLRWDKKPPVSWRNFFLFTDRMIHWFERVHIRPLPKSAINRAKEWMLERFEKSDGLGAIYPAMLNS